MQEQSIEYVAAQSKTISSVVIDEHVPLHDKNWFGTGGAARYFCEPTSAQQFQEALAFAHEQNLDIFVLGAGANILISDAGFKGLVIKPALKRMAIVERTDNSALVYVQSGAGIQETIQFCLTNTIIGLEEFSGIPGTIGGAVYINIHYFEFLLAQFISSATVIERATGAIHTVDAQWFNFGYNSSRLQAKEYFLIDVTLRLKAVSTQEALFAQGRRYEMIRYRTARYPTKNTCGSFFRNFLPDEVTLSSNGKKLIYIAYYLDKVGVKGTLSVGDAIVSYQHANMIINKGNATTSDIIQLARAMQERVYETFGVMPVPECELIGFEQFPLHTPNP